MENKARFILIGTGGFGLFWCRDIIPYTNKFATLVAAVDIEPKALYNPVQYLGFPKEKCYTNARKALEENEADFVVLVLPPAFREEMVDLAMEYNLHILCEKPYADSMEASCRIYRKVRQKGLKLAVTMSHRYEDDKQTFDSLIKSGIYGQVNYITSRLTLSPQRTLTPRNRPGHAGGVEQFISEALIHNLDMIRGFSDANAKYVYAKAWGTSWHIGMSGYVLIEMENGIHALCEASFNNATTLNGWGREYFRAECEKATLEVDNRQLTARSHLGFPNPEVSQIPLRNGEYWDHKLLMKMFVDWIKGGEAHPTSIEDNIQCAALTFAAVESARMGQRVDVQAFLKMNMEQSGH